MTGVIILAVIFMPASNFLFFRLLFLLVHLFRLGRMSLPRLLVLIVCLLSHESLLINSWSFRIEFDAVQRICLSQRIYCTVANIVMPYH